MSKVSVLSKFIALGISICIGFSGQAMAMTKDRGVQPLPSSITLGDSFNSLQNQFVNDYLVSKSTESIDSISSRTSLGGFLGIRIIEARLFSRKLTHAGATSTLLHEWSSANPITLASGSTAFENTRNIVGTTGGSYVDSLNTFPASHVPEVAPWVMLLLGLLMTSIVIARRNQYSRLKVSDNREGARVIDTYIDALSWGETLVRIAGWARARESRYVCICNVHSVMTARNDSEFKRILNMADMATPDGMPVAWMLSKQGFVEQERINGPDLMWKYCALAARGGDGVYLYGSTNETLKVLTSKLKNEFPDLSISGSYSPPFRTLSEAEDEEIIKSINSSGAGVVFVSLGCPKQEKWMEAHRNRIHAVMIGVGAAFDYHAGTLKRAPLWMQKSGLEWFHRLCSEPRRLWKRYLVTNTLFIIGAGIQLMHIWRIMPLVGNISFARSSRGA